MSICVTKISRILIGIIFLLAGPFVHAAEEDAAPVPRFVSLASARVLLRVGPSKTYPVAWEIKRKGMPVEIILEYDSWRKVRDNEGTEGWVHKSSLSGARAVLFVNGKHALLKKPEDQSKLVAYVEGGAIGRLKKYNKEWCQIKIDRYTGWVRRESIWGLYPHELNTPSKCWIPFLCRDAAKK